MNYLKSFFVHYWYYFVIGVLVLIMTGMIIFICFSYNKEEDKTDLVADKVDETTVLLDNYQDKICLIDIKGSVKKPGVYEIECSSTINDAIKIAGGKTKTAYTDNINLSKKVTNEMVIYIYSTKEIKNKEEKVQQVCVNETIYIDTCKDKEASIIVSGQPDNDVEKNGNDKFISNEEGIQNNVGDVANNQNNTENSEIKSELISLNNATKEQLMTLTGIGESKAVKIIAYRDQNGGFKTIDELKNVSGIGDAIFEKIKEYITI